MKIQILGTGCPKCKKLAEVAEEAAKETGMQYTVEKVEDISDIMEFGIFSTPGLAVNGKLVCSGSVPTVERVRDLLQRAK